ncbi:hypothetical protein [Rhodomicrobium sp. Az07]|nr:hypothetical protein [Rhodomicrobium sp. Az07]
MLDPKRQLAIAKKLKELEAAAENRAYMLNLVRLIDGIKRR